MSRSTSTRYFCHLCNMENNDEAQMDRHVCGPSHRKLELAYKRGGGSYFCSVCSSGSKTRQDFFAHLKSRAHNQKHHSDSPSTAGLPSSTPVPKFTRKKQEEEFLRMNFVEKSKKDAECWICKVELKAEEAVEHVLSASHQSTRQTYTDRDGYLNCSKCSVSTSNAPTFLQHLQSKKHQHNDRGHIGQSDTL